MREKKFRAWDTVKKVMYSAEELGADQETLSVDGRGFVNVSGTDTRLSEFHTHLLPLEFTGLKDKNKVEIYEDDIVKVWEYPDDSAEVMIGIAEVYGWGASFVSVNRDIEMGSTCETMREVIGNKYENPELMEESK